MEHSGRRQRSGRDHFRLLLPFFFFFWFVVGPHPVPMPSDGPDFHWHANLHQGRVQRMITPSSGEGIYSGRGAGRRGCGVALEPRGWRTGADRAGPDDAPRAGQDRTHVRVHTGVRCRYPCTGGGGGTHTASSEMRP